VRITVLLLSDIVFPKNANDILLKRKSKEYEAMKTNQTHFHDKPRLQPVSEMGSNKIQGKTAPDPLKKA